MRRFLILLTLFYSYSLPLSVFAQTSDPVIVAAGDISCPGCHQLQTSNLVISLHPAAVLALGDEQYPHGSLADFRKYYDPTWGRFKAITYPVPGNHEYLTKNAAGYFSYFSRPGYYSFDIASWHLIALDSESDISSQSKWLQADLAAHPVNCTLAYWHQPRYSSGTEHGSNPAFEPWWHILSNYQADVVLAGHEHNYERFAPMSGITEFVIGTGGKSLYPFGKPIPGSDFRDNKHFGVLKLVLHPTSYDWQFISDSNQVLDSGTASCIGVLSLPKDTWFQNLINLFMRLARAIF